MIKRAKAKEAKVTVHRPGPALRGRLLRGSALTASLLAVALTAGVEPVHANPEGGTVVSGDATINPIDGGSLQIDQVSDRVVIDWTSFSIDEGETVDFNQPDAGAIALNRVTGFDTSYINGVLTADGYVFLVNPNGVIFGASAFVDVGGLVASTADITNDDFMAGNFNFSIASANEAAMVANYGSITVAEAGLAALVAPTVRNSGIISANLGTVALAGARTFTLDFYGDGLFSFDTGATVTEAPEDGGALVENTGVITASGGHVFITALGAEDIINNAINMDGIIEAHTVGLDQGTIVLTGGDAGQVTVAGNLDVSGDDAGESGGNISITGDNIVIDSGGVLAADAHTNGDGGDIIMVADNAMTFEGALTARGGSESGDGGFAEISGEEVNVWASVNLSAANGEGGTLYIDPTDENIDAGEATAHSTTLGNGTNVLIEADNDIFVDNAIDSSGGTATGGDLTLTSGRSTEINADITLNDGVFTSNINTQPVVYGGTRAAGTATFTNNATIDTNGGNVLIQSGTLSATSSNVVTGAIITDGGTIDINTDGFVAISTGTLDGGGGNISVTATGDITVGDGAGTAIDASAGGDVALDAGANIVDGAGLIDMAGGGTLTLDAGGAVGSNAAIKTTGSFSIDGSAGGSRWYVSNGGGTVTIGDITASSGYIDFFNLGTNLASGTLSADSLIYLVGIDTTVSGSLTATTINLTSGSLDIQSTLTATDIDIYSIFAASDISLNGAGALDLTNAELALLDATGTVTFGNLDSDELTIGAGTDISGQTYDLTLAASGTISFDDSATALTADVGQIIDITGSEIAGGGTMTDIAFTGVGTGQLDFDAGGAAILDVSGNASLDGTATGAVTYVNTGDLTVEGLSGTTIDVDVTGDTTVNTGTIVAGGDLTLTSSGTITVGSGAGTAIDASGGIYDVTLDAGADIVDGGGAIDMGGGTLTLDATTGVGSSGAAIDVILSAASSLAGSNGDGDFYVDATGGNTLTVQDVTSAGVGSIGNLSITNDNADIDVTGTVLADSDASFDAGTGAFSNSGAITANVGGGVTTGGDVTIIADAVAINNTITGRDIFVAPDTAGTTIRLADGVATDFSLDATEIANLVVDVPATGELTIGTAASGDIFVGGGATADFSTSVNVVTLRGATLTFDDSATALQMGDGATLTLDLTGAINGGGTSTDIFHGGAGNGVLNVDAGGSVVLATDAELALAGTSSADFTLANTGTLAVDELNAAAINLDATDDITIETGTIVAGGDVAVTSSGTITVGDGAGTAIDASGGVYDVALDAGEDIVDGGGIIDMTGGGTLTLDAQTSVGSSSAAIETSGTFSLTGSNADGDFYVDNSGGTLTVQDVVSAGVGGIGNLGITNADADIDVTGTVLADGDATFDAGTATITVSGAVTSNVGGGVTTGGDLTLMAGGATITGELTGRDVVLTADNMDIGGTVTASGDVYVDVLTAARDIALNDSTGSTLNLTNAELGYLSTNGTVQIGSTSSGDIYVGGDGSVDVTGESWSTVTLRTDGTVFVTNGIETQDTDVTLDANVELTGNTLVDTVNAGTGADVHVTGTIEGSTTGAETLTIAAGTGDITFDSAVGGSVETGNLGLSGNNITVTDIATDGSQTYTATGEVTFGSDYTTNGNTFDLTGGLTLADDVLVDTSIPAGTGANITIDDVTNNGYTLTLDAGNDGDIALDSWTNTGAFDGLGTLNITDSDNTTISGTVSGDTLHVFDSTTEVSLLGDVDLASLIFDTGPYGVTITGSNVFLVDQVTFNNLGDVTLGDNSGDVFVFTGGVDATNGGVLVSGNFSFSGTGLVASSLSLEADTTLSTDATMLLGDVFGNGYTLNLDGETTGDITIATFQNTVGTGQLHLIDADEFLATGAVTADTVDIDTAQTSVIFQGLVTANSFLVGVGTYFTSLIGGTDITNFVTFLNSGGVQIGDGAGDVSLFSGGLQSTASDTSLGGIVRSEGGNMTFQNVLLVAATSIESGWNTVTAGDVLVNGWIDSASGTSHDLDIIGDAGSTTTIVGNVGDVDPLGSLDIRSLNINLHDVSTVGAQTYDTVTGAGLVTFNSLYQTQGADVDVDGAVLIGDHATVDTTWGGAYQTGDIRFGSTGQDISFGLSNGTLTLISGGLTTVRGTLAGALNEFNSLTIWARLGAVLNGGTLGNDLTIHAGAFDGDLVHTPNSHIVFNGITTIGDTTDLTATGDITFLGPEFNTYSLIIRLNGLAESTVFSPINIEENFSVGGLTEGEGSMSIWGSIRGVDSGQAASFGQQLEEERRDDILFNDCIVEVGCLNFDPSAIVIPVFDPVIYLYEREGIDEELRYSDLPNTEIWYRLGGAPDIWDERLGTSDDDDEDEGGGNGQSSQGGNGR